MELITFLSEFQAQFIDAAEITIHEDTLFRNLESWDSLTGMSIIVMIKDIYDVQISDGELKVCYTVKDVFNLVLSKL